MNLSSFKWGVCVLASTLAALTASQSAFGQNLRAGANQELEEARQVAALKAAQKLSLAEEIVAEKEAVAQRALDPVFREQFKQVLASSLSREELEAAVYDPGSVPLVLGDSSADLVYTPVTPCRIIDTRLAGGPIAGGTTRDFFAAGVGFAGQGGFAGDCGVPLGPATAVAMNIVAVTPAGSGNLRAFAWDSPAPPAPLAAVLNYSFLPAIANGIIVPICDPAVTGCTLDVIIQADVSTVHVVVDVVGYFHATDLSSAMPLGSTSLPSTTTVSGNQFIMSGTNVVLPNGGRCLVTCDVDIEASSLNSTIDLFIQTARRDVVAATNLADSGWGMDVTFPSQWSSASKTDMWNMTAGTTYTFGCMVQAFGDFIGETVFPQVSWVCR